MKLLIREDAPTTAIGDEGEEEEEENDENLPPSCFNVGSENEQGAMVTMTNTPQMTSVENPQTPPPNPLSRMSMLKSASKVVVTPVRRSIRQTPRAKVSYCKRISGFLGTVGGEYTTTIGHFYSSPSVPILLKKPEKGKI